MRSELDRRKYVSEKRLTGTQRIIQAYLEDGGNSMDEERYQKYKELLLTSWIYKYYDWEDCCNDCGFPALDHESAIDHQRVHHPDWFVVDLQEKEERTVKRNVVRRKKEQGRNKQHRIATADQND